jgi:hypothetical protein
LLIALRTLQVKDKRINQVIPMSQKSPAIAKRQEQRQEWPKEYQKQTYVSPDENDAFDHGIIWIERVAALYYEREGLPSQDYRPSCAGGCSKE